MMQAMLYQFTDFDVWCFASEDKVARIEAYLDCHRSNLNYTGIFSRMIYEKIKFYPIGKTKSGKLFLKIGVKRAFGKSKYMLPKDVYLDFLFLCKPDEMKNLLKISEDEKSELHNYLKQLCHLDDNLEETLENTGV